jgi:hypothetical protein
MIAQDDNPAKVTAPISQPLGVLLALMGLVITIILFVVLRAWHRSENVYFNASVAGSTMEEINARFAELERQHRAEKMYSHLERIVLTLFALALLCFPLTRRAIPKCPSGDDVRRLRDVKVRDCSSRSGPLNVSNFLR